MPTNILDKIIINLILHIAVGQLKSLAYQDLPRASKICFFPPSVDPYSACRGSCSVDKNDSPIFGAKSPELQFFQQVAGLLT